ncbi:MAG TPA: FHA domain-containing protein [Candidatus Obscuribacterales bacterium]
MSHLKPYSSSGLVTMNAIKQNPALSRLLFATQPTSAEQMATIIEPILQAPQRCSITPLYIQAIATEETTILATNLGSPQELQVTEKAASWLIGRNTTCAISIPDRSISRCHAVIGYYPSRDFYIADVGSSNGTWVNRRRLAQLERRLLQDGDLIQLGSLCVEFFVATGDRLLPEGNEATATHY